MTRNAKRFCVVYRTGGRDRFSWHRSASAGREETLERLDDVRKQGYQAHMDDYDLSLAIGLPETFE